MRKNISCYIISETNLGIQCAELLLEEEYQLLGIISAHNGTQQWAKSRNISLFSSLEDFHKINPYKTFDYLFSIINSKIIENYVLEYPRCYAINYHDAPLPKYAGVHATSWAILNNESTHGISWHIMTPVVDGGNILKRVTFPIDSDETALSLNLKCYTHALESFKDLIHDLAKGSLVGEKQDLKKRSYFSRFQKPSRLGFLSWDDSAQEIERQFRALYFGDYPNTFTTFKFLINNNIFIPGKINILPLCSQESPGTVIQITEHAIHIATKTKIISLSHFSDLKGYPCSIQVLIKKSGLSIGDLIQSPHKAALKAFQCLFSDFSPYEEFWAQAIESIVPTLLPFEHSLLTTAEQVKNDNTLTKEIIINDEFLKLSIDFKKEGSFTFTELFITSFLIYLYRLGDCSHFTIGIITPYLKNLPRNSFDFFPIYFPITFFLKSKMTANDILAYVKGKLAVIERNKAYCEDVYIRYPKIRNSSSAISTLIDLSYPQREEYSCLDEFPFVFTLDKENRNYTFKVKGVQEDRSKVLLKNFSEQIRNLFEDITQRPETVIEELSLLTQEEKHQLLVEWNDTKEVYPEDKTIQQLFEEQVERTPNNIAVVYEDQELSYQQLNERVNQLAHHLRDLGVKPDTLVAIAVERSLEMIIGILGILKAGGAYVPLDPSYPETRLQFMLEDTKAPILITQAHLNENFKVYSGITLNLNLHTQSEAKELHIEESSFNTENSQTQRRISPTVDSSENPQPLTTPHNLAYVIYTSGSTGYPKGVMIGHGNFIHYMNHAQKTYSLSNGPTLLHSSPAFDMSITSLFLPLVTGNFINILPGDPYLNALADRLKTQNNFSFIKLTPTHLKVLSNQLSSESTHKQKTVLVVGGENLLNDDVRFWLEANPDTPLFNEYGPTEATVGCCVLELKDYRTLSSGSVPIGRPISNTQIYVLDEQLNPVSIGVSGEIYIGGAGLARGYLNRPDLTADRFIPNPFVDVANIQEELSHTESFAPSLENLRLYRTGDLARYFPDGNIEFLGRMDDQVKIRGFRIELGEIESVLQSHGDIAQAVVMARTDESDEANSHNSGNKKLVAYVVLLQERVSSLTVESELISSAGEAFSVLNGESLASLTEGFRDYLTRSLPDYMVPSFFVYIDRVPLTPNGKIDRKALPAPDLSLRFIDDDYVAPQTTLEQDLCSIWKDILKVEKIGIHDNFFKLGGHSLLATQVISRIRHTYNIDIPLRALFEQPTLGTLSQIVDSLKNESVLSSLPPLVPQTRKGPLRLSFAQQRLWFLDQLLPDTALYNIPLAIRLKGSLDTAALERAINTLIERHESLRTIFPSTTGEASQEILPHLEIHLIECVVDLTSLEKKEQTLCAQSLAQQEATTPFKLSSEPLIRVKLLILAKEEHVLLITLHHIISDGWSMGVFFKELSELYNAYAAGEEASLPTLPLQYADFALWQRDWLQGKVLEQQLSYWKQQLSGIPDLLNLPTDKPRPKELSYKGATYHYSFSKEIKDQLNQLAQQQGASLFMTLLAAFQVLLYRYTGQQDIVVGSPIANRHYKEIEGLIGFFVNTLALRTTFEDNETFIDVLNRVKETTLQAYQHQDVPFEQLVDHLNISRVLNRNPVFQVMFTFQNTMNGEPLTFKHIQAEPFSRSYPIAKFDLSLSVQESEETLEVTQCASFKPIKFRFAEDVLG